MTRVESIGTFIAGTATIATLIGGAIPLYAQGTGHEPVIICIGLDRVLRSVKTTQPCGNGEKRHALAEAKSEIEDPKVVDTGEPKGTKHPSEARVRTLEEEVRQLQRELIKTNELLFRAPGGPTGGRLEHRVVAPFEVVDAAGKPIFEVRAAPRGFRLLTATGQAVAFGGALEGGGFFKGISTDGDLESVIGVDGKVSLLKLRKGGTALGTFAIGDDGKAVLNVANDDGVSVVSLYPGASGGGVLQLGNAEGNSMVEAGVTAAGIGVVRTYPSGNPGAGLLGLPGTFISGRKRQ